MVPVQLLLAGCVNLMSLIFSPVLGFATDVTVTFNDVEASPLAASSVSIIKADVVRDGKDLRLTGVLKRPHPLPMAGHLHAYTYSADNELTADSKHRVLGLSSKRGGMMRVPFKVLLDDVSIGTANVFLIYHSPGHKES